MKCCDNQSLWTKPLDERATLDFCYACESITIIVDKEEKAIWSLKDSTTNAVGFFIDFIKHERLMGENKLDDAIDVIICTVEQYTNYSGTGKPYTGGMSALEGAFRYLVEQGYAEYDPDSNQMRLNRLGNTRFEEKCSCLSHRTGSTNGTKSIEVKPCNKCGLMPFIPNY